MNSEGWIRAGDFKVNGNQGLDGVYRRVKDGATEYAVLEAKSGRPSVRALGTGGGYLQGSALYIENRLQAYLKQGGPQNHLDNQSRMMAEEFLAATSNNKVQSYLTFANQGRNEGQMLRLPTQGIASLKDAMPIYWLKKGGGA